MRLPITGWKQTLGRLGYKVRWEKIARRMKPTRSDRFDWNVEALEPRMMLAGLVNFDSNTYSFSVAADLPYLGTVGVVHSSGNGVTYSGVGSIWPFAVNSSTGNVSLIASEAPDLGESFQLTLRASNGTDTDDAPVTVNVTSQTNADPNFNATNYIFNVPLDTPIGNYVGNILASDAENNVRDYWTDWAGPIAINPTNGNLYIYSLAGYTVGSYITFNGYVSDQSGFDSVPIRVNFVAATDDYIITKKDNFNNGGPSGFVIGPTYNPSGPQAAAGDPTITGADSLYEAQTYTLSLNKNAKTVNRWEVNWNDGTTPEIYPGNRTFANHVYADGLENHKITVNALVAGTTSAVLEGHSHGFWKQPHHIADWPSGITWNTLYESIFGDQFVVPNNLNFIGALNAQAKQYNYNNSIASLLRESVAAYLNSRKRPGLNYFYTTAQVISMTQAAFANGTPEVMLSTKDLFETQNLKGGTFTSTGGTEYTLTLTKDITVLNVPPTLQIGGPSTVNEAQSFNFSLSSEDPGQDTVQYWTINWGDGTQTLNGDPTSVPHTYANGPNTYIVTSTATDEDGTFSSNSWTIQVLDVAPMVAISGPGSIAEGSSYTLTATYSDPGNEIPLRWFVNWGDGFSDHYDYIDSPQTISHIYADGLSTANINASIFDGEGNFSTNSLPVNIINVAPEVSISGSITATLSQAYFLNLFAGNDPGADTINHWEINWGDGTSITTVSGNPSSTNHIYAAAGTFSISAKVFDEDGFYIPVPLLVNVAEPNVGIHLVENSDFAAQHTYSFTVPVGFAAVSMSFHSLSFDQLSQNRMNDAFEVALVQPVSFSSFAAPIFQRRDSVLNFSEGEDVELGGGTIFNATTGVVTIDISHLAVGTNAQIIARLVNNDTDVLTNVWLMPSLAFANWSTGVQISNVVPPGYQHPRQTTPVDFNHLVNVTPSLGVDYHVTSFTEGTDRLFADVKVRNVICAVRSLPSFAISDHSTPQSIR